MTLGVFIFCFTHLASRDTTLLMSKGIFITLEGIEGCGKSTQMNLLGKALHAKGHPVVLTREPGGTPTGEAIRKILLTGENREIHPLTELMLYSADRAQHVQEVINPALDQGKIVLCDRFQDSTLAYQGYGRSLDPHWIETLGHLATEGLKPNQTLLLDCPVEIGLTRSKARLKEQNSKEDRFEREDLAFHERVRKGFLEIALKEPDRFKVFNAHQTPEELHLLILKHIERYL